MTRTDVILALINGHYYSGHWWLPDSVYRPISQDFVLTAHYDWVNSLPSELRSVYPLGGGKSRAVPKWIAEVYDCDNHASSFGAFLAEACALDDVRKGKASGSPAVGYFGFFLNPGAGHARNWFVTPEGRGMSFDAGLGDFTNETPGQLASIFEGASA